MKTSNSDRILNYQLAKETYFNNDDAMALRVMLAFEQNNFGEDKLVQ